MLVARDLGKAVRTSWAQRRRPDRRSALAVPVRASEADEPLGAALDMEALATLRAAALRVLGPEERAAIAMLMRGCSAMEGGAQLMPVGRGEWTDYPALKRARDAAR
jgi:hypothetical protein